MALARRNRSTVLYKSVILEFEKYFMEEKQKSRIQGLLSGPLQIGIVLILIAAAYLIGTLKTKVEFLEKGVALGGGSNSGGTVAGAVVPQPTSPPASADNVPKVNDADHVRGSKKARIALIEYSDIECPFCKRFHPTAKQILDTYKDDVMWVYRHYPLSFHANAQKEAEAVECANELGGSDIFWKYLDALYERTTSNGTGFALDALTPLAKELGLNDVAFKECLDSGKFAQHIQDDMNGGSSAGVTGTPGNILLDTKTGKTLLIPGAVPFEQIKPDIDAMLKS